jgi:hypothetical protein
MIKKIYVTHRTSRSTNTTTSEKVYRILGNRLFTAYSRDCIFGLEDWLLVKEGAGVRIQMHIARCRDVVAHKARDGGMVVNICISHPRLLAVNQHVNECAFPRPCAQKMISLEQAGQLKM